MGVSCGNTSRLIFMLTLVVIYFLVELIVGISIHSISLVADSFHMLSDCLALVIGIVASQIAKWPRSSRNTFGWQRAEVMGSLINTVVLITLCMTILLRAIERFVETQAIESAQMMVYVGCGGLLVNILGLIVLGGHSHDGSHSETDPAISAPLTPTAFGTTLPLNNTDDAFLEVTSTHPISGVNNIYDRMDENVMQHFTDKDQRDNFEASQLDTKQQKVTVKVKHNHPKKSHKSSMNMQAVFLHVLADFMGSVIVVISALVLWLVPGEVSKGEAMWKLYIDPAMSMLMVTIILITAIPLMYKAALILLQSVPSEICLTNLKTRMENIDGIHKIHDLHVWRLQSNCIIGTVHIRCVSLPDYLSIAREVKQLFHEFNIHCTTIQPEFEENIEGSTTNTDYLTCVLDCGPNKNCQSDTCCPASNIPPPNATAVQFCPSNVHSASQNSFNLIQNGMGNLPSNDVHIDISQNRQS
ncbi:Zinc/cadmium resistance protein isoform 1 [Schistosoma japonicum]|uniref:Zinc/cadmium resistance protein isoform 1 n=1 Tax=Schistosoma japonicum TaxID=6182 RepID=A0A4Z2CR77_SCHJA|nr:Zinc transporter 1 [Schistosoma japonicum]TNN06688.1 Zinc/cadmium resistance protein isoform 1 [Schistosoma japonicum]